MASFVGTKPHCSLPSPSIFSFEWFHAYVHGIKMLVGSLEHFLCFHILGIIIPTDKCFSEGLKPPTRMYKAEYQPPKFTTRDGFNWGNSFSQQKARVSGAFEKTKFPTAAQGLVDNLLIISNYCVYIIHIYVYIHIYIHIYTLLINSNTNNHNVIVIIQ